jgi:hypothetical protein
MAVVPMAVPQTLGAATCKDPAPINTPTHQPYDAMAKDTRPSIASSTAIIHTSAWRTAVRASRR